MVIIRIIVLFFFCLLMYLRAILNLALVSGHAFPDVITSDISFIYSFFVEMNEYITVKIVIPIPNIDKLKVLMSVIKSFILTHIISNNTF